MMSIDKSDPGGLERTALLDVLDRVLERMRPVFAQRARIVRITNPASHVRADELALEAAVEKLLEAVVAGLGERDAASEVVRIALSVDGTDAVLEIEDSQSGSYARQFGRNHLVLARALRDARRAVEAAGGVVAIDSTLGGGTTLRAHFKL